MSQLTCPYCGKETDPDDDQHEPDVTIEATCRKCGKTFVYTIEYYPTYTEYQADCLNGGEHDYQPVSEWPEDLQWVRMRCTMCDDEKRILKLEKKL
jgi:hypothetical protein